MDADLQKVLDEAFQEADKPKYAYVRTEILPAGLHWGAEDLACRAAWGVRGGLWGMTRTGQHFDMGAQGLGLQ